MGQASSIWVLWYKAYPVNVIARLDNDFMSWRFVLGGFAAIMTGHWSNVGREESTFLSEDSELLRSTATKTSREKNLSTDRCLGSECIVYFAATCIGFGKRMKYASRQH